MLEAGAGAAADRRHHLARPVPGVSHKAVGVCGREQLALYIGTIEFAAGDELVQTEGRLIQRMVAATSRSGGECLDLALQRCGYAPGGPLCVRGSRAMGGGGGLRVSLTSHSGAGTRGSSLIQ